MTCVAVAGRGRRTGIGVSLMSLTTGDMPSIGASSYSTSTIALNQMAGLGGLAFDNTSTTALADHYMKQIRRQAAPFLGVKQTEPEDEVATTATKPTRRVVQVFIADPSEKVPLEQALLYQGEVKMTDLTDQELFFEIDIKTILTAYNEKRVKIVDKEVKDRTEYLEPVKIRDLKMVVVTVAGF